MNRVSTVVSRACVKVLIMSCALLSFQVIPAHAQLVQQVPDVNTTFTGASSVAADAEGNVYVLETTLGRITRVNTNGSTVLFAGGGSIVLDPTDPTFQRREAEANRLNLAGSQAMRFAPDGSLYVSDTVRNRIIRISREPRPGFEGSFYLVGRVVAGDGGFGYAGDGDLASLARLATPTALTFDSAGNLYIADAGNFRVRRVSTAGIITTVAGNGADGFTGDGLLATEASITTPRGLTVDAQGNLYISMYDSAGAGSRVRRVSPQGIITTFAGNGGTGFTGDSGPAASATLNSPFGLATDTAGFVYIADSLNHRIRIVTPNQRIQTIAGTGEGTDSGVGGQAITTALNVPRGLAFAPSGDLLVADSGNLRVLRISGVQNAPRVTFENFTPATLSVYAGGPFQNMQIGVQRFNFTGNVGFTITDLPNTLTGGVISPALGSTGTLSLTAVPGSLPSSYPVTLQAYALNSSGEAVSAISTVVIVNIVPTPTLSVNPTSLTFSGVATGSNPATQTIQVSDALGGFINWSASRTTTSGGNWLSLAPSSGDQTTPLIVAVNIQGMAAGTYIGNVQISAPGANGTPKDVPVTLTLTPPAPQITSNGVQNNASYNRALTSVAPGSIAAIFGSALTNGQSCLPPNCNPQFGSNGRLSTTMVGASVTVNGVAVPMFYARPDQLGIQIPTELGPGTADVRVTVDGRQGNIQSVTVDPTSPGIFTQTSDGIGAGAVTHADGSAVTAGNPARPSEVLILYVTGLGGTTPAAPTGALATEPSSVNQSVTLSVDGISVTPEFAGLSGCCVGLNQINFRVPAAVRTNTTVTVTLSAGGRIGNPVTLQIGAPQ
jgi:uncharacterized protein (TIGR03437 family)